MTTELFETPGDDVCALDGQVSTCSAQCRDLDRKDYTHLLWTTLAEFPGIMLTIVTIEYLGRKKTMALEFILLTIGLCFLFNCQSNRLLVTFIMFFVRGLASGVFQVCIYCSRAVDGYAPSTARSVRCPVSVLSPVRSTSAVGYPVGSCTLHLFF